MEQLKEQMENLLYPELRPYRRSDRDRLLREARETPFDFPEWAGILAALARWCPGGPFWSATAIARLSVSSAAWVSPGSSACSGIGVCRDDGAPSRHSHKLV